MTRLEGSPDALLRQFERGSAAACLAMAAIGWVATGWRWDVALGVLAGGGLMGASYLSIKGAVEAAAAALAPGGAPGPREPAAADAGLPAPETPGVRRRAALAAAVKYLARYALLAVAAYGILTCFHLHPAGLLAGALSPFAGALGLLVRMSRARPRAGRPL